MNLSQQEIVDRFYKIKNRIDWWKELTSSNSVNTCHEIYRIIYDGVDWQDRGIGKDQEHFTTQEDGK